MKPASRQFVKPFRLPFVLLLLLLPGLFLGAQVPIRQADLNVHTQIAPAYFGPNAFPVPDAFPTHPSRELRAELAGDYYRGHLADGQDYTWDPLVYVEIPLWSKRVSMAFWGPIREWYSMSEAVAEARRVPEGGAGTGNDTGDLYVATYVNLLEEKGCLPEATFRAVLKTAAGDDYGRARHYDAPGYYFDLLLSKSYTFPSGSFFRTLQAGLDVGFLYWQTDNGRQNDAHLYGIMGQVDTRAARLTAQWGGYCGWEADGDSPAVVKLRLDIHASPHLEPFFYFQQGLKDWPFTHFRLGLCYSLDLWSLRKPAG